MVLYTKSMLSTPEESDGIRICIMRNILVYNRHKFLFELNHRRPIFDIRLLELAPSAELKKAYKHENMGWNEFSDAYANEVFSKERELIRQIANYCLEKNATFLCSEHSPDQCHRKLLAEECKKYEPRLHVVLS